MDLSADLARISRSLPDIRGKSTLGWALMRFLERHNRLSGEWQIELRDGTRYVMPRRAAMAWGFAFQGSYDIAGRNLVAEHVARESLVLDIGASLGLWTVDLARRAQARRARVWAFEPHPNNHPWLCRNLALNDLDAVVQLQRTALGDTPGTARMPPDEASISGGNAAIGLDGESTGIAVPIATLDSIQFPMRVSVIKLDVEGYELRVLRGAERLIDRDRPVIFGEFGRQWLEFRGESLDDFVEEMRSKDYETFIVDNTRTRAWRPHDAVSLRPYAPGGASTDLLLKPRARR